MDIGQIQKAAWFLVMSQKANLEAIYIDAMGETDHNTDPEFGATAWFKGTPPKPANHFAQWLKGVKTQ